MNSVNLVGRWTKDPQLRYTSDGKPVVNARLAINRPGAKEGKQEADFISIVIWGKAAEATAQYTKKGSTVAIEAKLRSRVIEREGQQTEFRTDVVASRVQFLDKAAPAIDVDPNEEGNETPIES